MSDLSLPPDYVPTLPVAAQREINIVKLAREIAMDIRTLGAILETHSISRDEFELLKRNPYFTRVLAAEVEAWESAVNTSQRVRLKAQALAEEFLPELYKRLINPKEDLMKVAKGTELVIKLSGLGIEEKKDIDPSSRVVINISMGEGRNIKVAKALPPQVIDHEPSLPADAADELQQNLFEASLDVDHNQL